MAREALSQETALTGSLAMHSHRLKHAHFQGAPPNRPHPQTGLPTEHEHAIQNHNTPNTPENDWRETKNQAFPDLKDFLRERAKDCFRHLERSPRPAIPEQEARARGTAQGVLIQTGLPKGWQPRSRDGAWRRGRGPRGQSWPRRCHPWASGRGWGRRGQGGCLRCQSRPGPAPTSSRSVPRTHILVRSICEARESWGSMYITLGSVFLKNRYISPS